MDKLQEVCEIRGVNRGVVECIGFLECKVLSLDEWVVILLGLPNPWKVKALVSFEMSDIIYSRTQRHNSEDQNTLHAVCRTTCTKSAEHSVQSLQKILTKSAEHTVQSLQNIMYSLQNVMYRFCRTSLQSLQNIPYRVCSTDHPVQSLQNVLYKVYRTPCTKSAEHPYKVCRMSCTFCWTSCTESA
jgi:hypothetical protein